MQHIHTIASFAKPQPDTIAAIFLLKKYGEELFPGVSQAKLELWTSLPPGSTAAQLEEEGYILIDLGHGRFDHHLHLENGKPVQCASEMVADKLRVATDPSLKKLLAYARRDDLEGKGTASSDPLDRAFGLSGLLTTLNKAYAHDLIGVINIVLAIFEAHHQEEENRTKIMPAQWKALCMQRIATEWSVQSPAGWLRAVQLPTDNPGMAGFLKAYHHYDLVVIRRSSGHVNIITNQAKPIDLAPCAVQIRRAELIKANQHQHLSLDLHRPGRLDEVPHWYYDTAANTLQNGGTNPVGVPSTQLSEREIQQALRAGLQVEAATLQSRPTCKRGIIWAALQEESLPALKKQVPKLYEKTFHLHVTLAYDVTSDDASSYQVNLLGQEVQVLVTGYAYNSSIQAALINLNGSGLTTVNPHPHLTISAQPGVSAAASNEMLAGPHESVFLPSPLSVKVRVEFSEFK